MRNLPGAVTTADPHRDRQPRDITPYPSSNSPTQVRLLTGRDWALLRDIRLRALAGAPEAFGATLSEAQARTEQQWRDRITQRAQFIAVTGPAMVGTVAGAPDPDRDSVHLCSLWVDPCARGAGIADQLVQAVIGWAAENGRARIRIEITEGNSHAEHLYARTGFTRTGRTGTISPDDPRPEFEMTRTISETPS